MKEENAALADASWLAPFITETPDAKPATSPDEIVSTPLTAQRENSNEGKALINLDGDWGYPHPYKSPPKHRRVELVLFYTQQRLQQSAW